MTDSLDRLDKAFARIAVRPAGFGFLGRGDGSGVIVADLPTRALWYQPGPGLPPATARLRDSIDIRPYIGTHPELEVVRVTLGFPPENPTVLYITGFDQAEGLTSVVGMTPSEQLNSAQSYLSTGNLVNFRIAPNEPGDGEVYINPGWYIDSSGNPAWWGGDSSDTLCATARAALSSGEHQMGVLYIDNSTGAAGLLTNTAETGGVNDKQLFDTTTIVEMTWADGYIPCGAVHLYYGQTEITEDDIYRTADPRNLINATGATTGMASFDLAADTGTPATIGNGDTLTIAGSSTIDTSITGSTVSISVQANSITANEIAANAVGSSELADDAVDTNAIQNDAVTAAKIAAGAVGSSELADTAVTPGSYTNASLTVDQDGRLTAASNGTTPVTSVGASAPIASSGGATPTISHDASGVSSGTLIKPKVTVNTTGHITAAEAGVMGVNAFVRVATIAALPACTYANGTSGVGATLTANANGTLTIRGVSVATNDRVLINDQVSLLQNGVYVVTQTGSAGTPFILTRATDADESDEIRNSLVVELFSNRVFLNKQTAAITIGTDNITFQQVIASTINGVLDTANGGTKADLSGAGAAHHVLFLEGAGNAVTVGPIELDDIPLLYARLSDSKSSGTNGGTSSNATWNARDLNTEDYDPNNLVSISSNQFTPISGTYLCIATSTMQGGSAAISNGRNRIWNVTDSVVAGYEGTNGGGAIGVNSTVTVVTIFSTNGSKAFRVETYTTVGRATVGLGAAESTGNNEPFTTVFLQKIG